MHGNVARQGFVARHIDQHTNLAAMDITGEFALTVETDKAAYRHVFAHLADQLGAERFHGGAIVRQCRQGSHVSRILIQHHVSQRIGERQEIVILGHEIGFAVHFHHGSRFAIGTDGNRHDAFSGDTTCTLGGLVAETHTQDFVCLLHIAARFGQRFLAIHHR